MTSPSRSDMSELIDEAIAALEPFAACAPSKRDADFYAWGSRMDGLTWGDFRRADSTLSRLKEASGGGEGTGLGTSQDHAPASGSALDWRPIESAPKDGRPFCVRALTTYRWSFYKPDGRRQMRKPGRWQVAGEYGGWDNAELPEGAEWSPYITPVQSGAEGEARSTGMNKTPIPPPPGKPSEPVAVDRTKPCPTCGFHIVLEQPEPYVFEDAALPSPEDVRGIPGPPPDKDGQSLTETYQARVMAWMAACFGDDITNDPQERAFRFLEEALELAQAVGATESDALALVAYTFARPTGEVAQEVGGVMVCLAALCGAIGEDVSASAEAELSRVWTKIEKIRAKHAAKPKDVRSALPGDISNLRSGVQPLGGGDE